MGAVDQAAVDLPRAPAGSREGSARSTLRDSVRMLLLFTPWVSIPLALLGVASVVCVPLVALTSLGWIAFPIAVGLAVALAAWLRPRQQITILESSHLGVFLWLRRRY